MRSLRNRAAEEEQMDAPDLPAAVYRKVLDDLAGVNRLTMATRPTIKFLDRALGGRTYFKLLDVGYGQGDMLRTIARWASCRGIDAELVGVDLNPNSEIVAREAAGTDTAIRFTTGDYRDYAGHGYDFIISSLVAHHMQPQQLRDFLRFMESEARTGWMVNDLHRHLLAYAGFPILARIMGWHRIVREDGQLSIARAFRPSEWGAILADAGIATPDARVIRRFPFRLCVERAR